MRAPFGGGANSEIIVPYFSADTAELEFLEVIKDFSPRDLLIVARLLERLQHISTHQGQDAALAVIERLCAKEQPSRR